MLLLGLIKCQLAKDQLDHVISDHVTFLTCLQFDELPQQIQAQLGPTEGIDQCSDLEICGTLLVKRYLFHDVFSIE